MYYAIREYIVDSLEHDPRASDALDRLSSWAEESYVGLCCFSTLITDYICSAFVQELPEGTVEE